MNREKLRRIVFFRKVGESKWDLIMCAPVVASLSDSSQER